MPVRLLPAALGAMVLAAGCAQADPPPSPAADGRVVVRHWQGEAEAAAAAPVILVGTDARVGADLAELRLTQVRMRIPIAPGSLRPGGALVTAPSGILRTVRGSRRQELVLDGPIAIQGSQDGRPFAGRASRARLRADGLGLDLEGLDLVQRDARDAQSRRGDALLTRGFAFVVSGTAAFEIDPERHDPELLARVQALPLGYLPPDPSASP